MVHELADGRLVIGWSMDEVGEYEFWAAAVRHGWAGQVAGQPTDSERADAALLAMVRS